MPRQPEPPEPEYKEIETFRVYPVPADPDKDDTRDIYVKREVLERRPVLPDKLGPEIYTDTTGAVFEPTGEKDKYQDVMSGKIYRRDRTKYG